MRTGYDIGVHVRKDTKMVCKTLDATEWPECQVVRIDGLTIYLDTPDLERLHAVISALLAELARQVAA